MSIPSNILIHLFNIYLSTLECNRYFLNLTYFFLHPGTLKKVNKPKQWWHMLHLIHVGGKGEIRLCQLEKDSTSWESSITLMLIRKQHQTEERELQLKVNLPFL